MISRCGSVRSLRLADGTAWTFAAPSTGGFASWMDEFAHILQLTSPEPEAAAPRCSGRIRIRALDKNRAPDEADASWSSYSQGSAYKAWIGPGANDAILEISPEFIDHPEIRYIYMSAALRIVFLHCLVSGSGGSFHAASAVFGRSGIIITASGQTGKSTCYNRLPGSWTRLADDTALAVKTAEGRFAAHPMPTWSDYLRGKKKSTFPTQSSYPLRALFFLKRGEKDEVEPVSPAIAAGMLQRLSREAWAAFFNRLSKDRKKQLDHSLFNMCCSVAQAAPAFILRATLHGEFWREIEKVL